MKGIGLQDERYSVYRMKGKCLQDTAENLRPATDRIGIFILKVSVYRIKGKCLYWQILSFVVDFIHTKRRISDVLS